MPDGKTVTRIQRTIAAASAFAAAMLATVAYLAVDDWFGAGDLSAMSLWSLALFLTTYATAGVVARRRSAWRYVVAVLLGPLNGILVTVIAALVLGPWMGAFSFPAPLCWTFGGLAGLTVAAWLPNRSHWVPALALPTAAVGVLIAISMYLRAPERRIALYLKPNASEAEIQRVWDSVIGRPSGRGHGVALLKEISGAGLDGYKDNEAVISVTLWPHTSQHVQDSLVGLFKTSSLVSRVVVLSPSDSGQADVGVGR